MKPHTSSTNGNTGLLWALGVACAALILFAGYKVYNHYERNAPFHTPNIAGTPVASSTPQTLPPQALLQNGYYTAQTFNNCGPAALSMDLSFYGVDVSQETIADAVRPDHNETGHDDDKSTTPEQLAAEAESYGLVAYYRPAGSVDLLKKLVAAGFPVLVRTLFMPTDQVAHYRVVKGYNDATGQLTEEDGYQGPNVTYSYADFESLWKYYNNEYIVLATPAQQTQLEQILGSDANATVAWQRAANIATAQLAADPQDFLAEFNLSVASYYLGNYTQAVQTFEAVQNQLPPNALWYQIEPIESYYELGQYDKVFSLTQAIFDQGNIAFPELYVLRGESYQNLGNTAEARLSFQTALQYNQNLQSAKDALAALGSN